MKYWDAILKEVLEKEDSTPEISFTNVNDYRKFSRIKKAPKNRPGIKKIKSVKKPQAKKKYFLGSGHPGIYFTQRETQTIYLLMRGKTNFETAKTLGLSRRTIEFYIKNMKSKLHCHSKSELINKVIKSDLLSRLKGEFPELDD